MYVNNNIFIIIIKYMLRPFEMSQQVIIVMPTV
jgi:hypothetical protein